MTKPRRWTADEISYLEKNYHKSRVEHTMRALKRTRYSVLWKASELGILQRDGRRQKVTYKKIINVTKKHHDFLKKSRNNSHIIRLALDLYIKSQKT